MIRLLSFYLLLMLPACSNTKTLQKIPSGNPGFEFDKQGHRGCRGLMPENTIPAMIAALGLGVTTLEMDVVITKDSQVVLSHEPWMNSKITTKPDGSLIKEAKEKQYNIYKMTYEEARQYDVGMKPYPKFPKQQKIKVSKPLLVDLIDSVKQYMMMARRPPPYYNIEIKSLPSGDNLFHPEPAAFVELVMEVVKQKNIGEYVILQSFDIRNLQYIHQKYPEIKTGLLINNGEIRSLENQLKDLGFKPDIYSPAFRLVTKDLIARCHRMQIRIIPWTVNSKAKMAKLSQMGVDGIITDYPDLFN